MRKPRIIQIMQSVWNGNVLVKLKVQRLLLDHSLELVRNIMIAYERTQSNRFYPYNTEKCLTGYAE